MFLMILLVAVAICIYWDWEAHAPEKQYGESTRTKSVPLSASVRKYEVREERVAS